MGKPRSVASTGIEGLDDILDGGFTAHRLYLVEGMPGSGKTTLALQFLIAAAGRGERVLYITLSETGEELREVSDSHGWSLDGVRHVGRDSAPGINMNDLLTDGRRATD